MKINKQGFTLIESIMVISLIAILAIGLGNLIVTTTKLWVFLSARQSAVKSSQSAMNRLVGELKRIEDTDHLLVSATWEVRFVNLEANTVDFKQVGGNLMRNSDILATGLISPEGQGLRFTYLNSSGEVTSVKTNIRAIRVWLSLAAGNQTTTLESSARIRAYELQ